MTHDNWKAIWARRQDADGSLRGLDGLLQLDGFDSGAAHIAAADWLRYSGLVGDKLGVVDGQSVFEIGCGAGAFLYALSQQHRIGVGGVDYAEGLIAAARRALPEGEFAVEDAAALDTSKKFDYVIANSVFQYLPLPTAANVLRRMMDKASVAVAVLDVPDQRTQEECETVRRAALPPDEYEKKYAGLAHTYYARSWFGDSAGDSWSAETFDGMIPNYGQNRFRFGVILRRAQNSR